LDGRPDRREEVSGLTAGSIRIHQSWCVRPGIGRDVGGGPPSAPVDGHRPLVGIYPCRWLSSGRRLRGQIRPSVQREAREERLIFLGWARRAGPALKTGIAVARVGVVGPKHPTDGIGL
jgi:hypothetical protein